MNVLLQNVIVCVDGVEFIIVFSLRVPSDATESVCKSVCVCVWFSIELHTADHTKCTEKYFRLVIFMSIMLHVSDSTVRRGGEPITA